MQFSEIVVRQADGWFIFKGHIPALIAFVIYLIAGNAEVNRGPFDLPEAESELTAGYHTEYSGMHFGLFYVAEFVNLFIVAGVAATIFLGGWMPLHISGWEGFNLSLIHIFWRATPKRRSAQRSPVLRTGWRLSRELTIMKAC